MEISCVLFRFLVLSFLQFIDLIKFWNAISNSEEDPKEQHFGTLFPSLLLGHNLSLFFQQQTKFFREQNWHVEVVQ